MPWGEPRANEIIETNGLSTVELQETKDRKRVEAVAAWLREDEASKASNPSPASIEEKSE